MSARRGGGASPARRGSGVASSRRGGAPGVRIRKATEADIPAVVRLLRELFVNELRHGYDPTLDANFPATPFVRERYRSSLRARLRTLLVAESRGRVVGYCYGVISAPLRFRKGRPRVAELVHLVVDPKTRGRGVGTALIEAFLEWTRAKGVTRAKLVVSAPNRRAWTLYRRAGFGDFEVILERDV